MSGKKQKEQRRKIKVMVDKKLKNHPSKQKDATLYYKQAKKLVKAGILTICAMLICNICHADKIGIFTVDPIKFQSNLAGKGFKLDLSFAEKTEESWGMLSFDSKGMCVNTYAPLNTDNLPIITEIMWESI